MLCKFSDDISANIEVMPCSLPRLIRCWRIWVPIPLPVNPGFMKQVIKAVLENAGKA
jgi:hypothetical protein